MNFWSIAKDNIPQILAILAIIGGGGTLQYNQSTDTDDQRHVSLHHAGVTADLIIHVYTLEKRIKKLEGALDN